MTGIMGHGRIKRPDHQLFARFHADHAGLIFGPERPSIHLSGSMPRDLPFFFVGSGAGCANIAVVMPPSLLRPPPPPPNIEPNRPPPEPASTISGSGAFLARPPFLGGGAGGSSG